MRRESESERERAKLVEREKVSEIFDDTSIARAQLFRRSTPTAIETPSRLQTFASSSRQLTALSLDSKQLSIELKIPKATEEQKEGHDDGTRAAGRGR